MAWQTPKTNWGAADSVRNTDFNRIEGNILELYNASGIKNDITIHVSAATGNDTTGNGTSSAPYQTITKALNSLPKALNGKIVNISVAGGTYAEAVTIKGFSDPIIFTGNSSTQITVSSFTVEGCHVILSEPQIVTRGAVTVNNGGMLTGNGRLSVSGSTGSITFANGSVVALTAIARNNATGFGISVDGSSRVHIGTLTGSSNASGILCQGGSVFSFTTNSMTTTGAMYQTYSGGRIYSGSQTSISQY